MSTRWDPFANHRPARREPTARFPVLNAMIRAKAGYPPDSEPEQPEQPETDGPTTNPDRADGMTPDPDQGQRGGPFPLTMNQLIRRAWHARR